ncbi:inactive ubiquitin carboxyl-terminal hydrolase MINDY-4B [Apus apus]|uniref:inactive ubiquitin carboxyl-terminal hydrolase MINDY-4B n=1 Tax=Apus apus TaxID=8895 RepID=UPI0021F868BC|nr:inactive ubiquitin carboxyl-terminal hydrolase MINDY-4B [Apus apus]
MQVPMEPRAAPGAMGEPGGQHTLPQMQLEEIASKISDLNKWKEIFSFHGLEISNPTHQVTFCFCLVVFQHRTSTGHGPPGAGEPMGPPPPPQPPSAVPRPLLVPPDTGGQPISLEMAMGLRQLLFGNVSHRFSCEWAQASFRFRGPYSDLAYALEAEKKGTRALLMAVQAHIIKYLLFVRNTEDTHLERLGSIGPRAQREALAAALAELLWAAAAGGRAAVCLLTPALRLVPRADYTADSFTERIQLFEFSEKAAAQEFIFDHINCFKGEGSHGVILFLYSLLFSRTLERVQEDLGCTATPLLDFNSGNITCTEAMLSLLLTGRASPQELDGGPEPGPGSETVEGQGWRGPVGYLRWGRGLEEQVCRGLRTPRLPVWLCGGAGGHVVLFSTDRQLLSDWKRERLFQLYLYSGQREQRGTARLTVDTHSHHWEKEQSEDPSSTGKRRRSVEMAIRTKWAGATISWNGTEPFF